MGIDIYLNSIWQPFLADWEKRGSPPPAEHDNPIQIMEARFEYFASSGGYFRNGYNGGDIMWAMGLSWSRTVSPMLDKKHRLPIEDARKLLSMIEERPLTKERLAAHYLKNMTDGTDQHPITGPLQEAIAEALGGEEDTQRPLPPDFEYFAGFLSKKREQLLTILRKSIERNEPLVCSM
jgi:hypothetical protein